MAIGQHARINMLLIKKIGQHLHLLCSVSLTIRQSAEAVVCIIWKAWSCQPNSTDMNKLFWRPMNRAHHHNSCTLWWCALYVAVPTKDIQVVSSFHPQSNPLFTMLEVFLSAPLHKKLLDHIPTSHSAESSKSDMQADLALIGLSKAVAATIAFW